MSEWNTCGEHRYRTDGDLLHWINGKEHSAAEIVELCSKSYELALRYGYSLLLVDCTRGGHVGSAGRKAVVEYHRSHPTQRIATAVIGAAAPIRVVGQLITRAMTMLELKSADLPLVFLTEEAAAFRWLTAQRQIFQSKLKEPKAPAL